MSRRRLFCSGLRTGNWICMAQVNEGKPAASLTYRLRVRSHQSIGGHWLLKSSKMLCILLQHFYGAIMYHYQPLRDFLAARGDRSVNLSFKEIETLIGRALPPSASGAISRQWWSNAPSHSQARAWLSLGRRAKLNLKEQAVTFSRPATPTTLPDAIIIDTIDLHPVVLRLLETIVSDHGMSVAAAATALLNSAANERQPKPE